MPIFQTILVPWERFSQTLLEFNKSVRHELSGNVGHAKLEHFPELVKRKKQLAREAQAQALLLLSRFVIAYSLENIGTAQKNSFDKATVEQYYTDEIPLDALRYISWIDGNDDEHQFVQNVLPVLFGKTFQAIQNTLFDILEIDPKEQHKDAMIDVEEDTLTDSVTAHANDGLKDKNEALRKKAGEQRELPPRRDKALIDNENTEQLILRHKERAMQRKKKDFKKELAKAFKGMK